MFWIIVLSLIILVGLILLRINAFLAFLTASLTAGLLAGLSPAEVIVAIEKGLGNSLGSLVVLLGFGAVIGKIMATSGAAQQIAANILRLSGERYLSLAMMLIGFTVGIPMFFSVGFVILVPVLFSVAKKASISPLYLGVPMMAALSTAHGILPPHPAPVALVKEFSADMSTTIAYGVLISIPAILLAGPVFASFLKKSKMPPIIVPDDPMLGTEALPSLFSSLLCALLPVILMLLPAIISPTHISPDNQAIQLLSQPFMAMVLSLFVTIYLLGIRMGKNVQEMMAQFEEAFSSVAMILLIIAGAGAYSSVCRLIGIDAAIAKSILNLQVSPIVLCWGVAAGIRIMVGSATVAATTTAGILAPVFLTSSIPQELLLLGTCSGSLIFSHVNDSGFWLVKEYFNLSIRQTLLSWSIMETIIAVAGLAGCLILNMFV